MRKLSVCAKRQALREPASTHWRPDLLEGQRRGLRWSGEDLRAIGRVIQTARDAFATVRFNLRFATVYNVAGVAVAAAGLLHPVVAAVLMMSSSLFVTYKTTVSVESSARRAWRTTPNTPLAMNPLSNGQKKI